MIIIRFRLLFFTVAKQCLSNMAHASKLRRRRYQMVYMRAPFAHLDPMQRLFVLTVGRPLFKSTGVPLRIMVRFWVLGG